MAEGFKRARQPKGIPVGGEFATMNRPESGIEFETINEASLCCPRCQRRVDRGRAHICSAPGFITITDSTQRVLNILKNEGTQPLIVGGSVRDAVLGNNVKDVDIEVYGKTYEEIISLLRQNGLPADEFGKSFAVIKTKIGDEDFDISLPRRDSKTGNGYTGFSVEIDHMMSFEEASGRRDLTINSVMYDPFTNGGQLIDCYGGLHDLEKGILRHTTDAFDEDPLRVLRVIQFAGRFGFDIDPNTSYRCQSLLSEYDSLSKERVWAEWDKAVLKGDMFSKSLKALEDTGWLAKYPDLQNIYGVPQDSVWHPEGDVDEHTRQSVDAAVRIAKRDGLSDEERRVLVFGVLAHDFGKATHTEVHSDGRVTAHGHAEAGVEPTERFLDSIKCPKSVIEPVAKLVKEHMCAATTDGPSKKAVRNLARRLGDDVSVEMWARVVEADNQGRGTASKPGPAGEWVRMARDIGASEKPIELMFSGRDLIDAGYRPGPNFKKWLQDAQSAQDNGVFGSKDAAKEWLLARAKADIDKS